MATGFGHVAGTGQWRGYGSPGTRSTGAYMIGARPFIVGGTIDADNTVKVTGKAVPQAPSPQPPRPQPLMLAIDFF